jgi:hypothetical protein
MLRIVNDSMNCGKNCRQRRQRSSQQETQGKARKDTHRTTLRERSGIGAGSLTSAGDAIETKPVALMESLKADLA